MVHKVLSLRQDVMTQLYRAECGSLFCPLLVET